MKESEQNQDCCGLDMAKGLHPDMPWMRYPQNIMHAPKSAYPQKNPKTGMKCDPKEIMNATINAKY